MQALRLTTLEATQCPGTSFRQPAQLVQCCAVALSSTCLTHVHTLHLLPAMRLQVLNSAGWKWRLVQSRTRLGTIHQLKHCDLALKGIVLTLVHAVQVAKAPDGNGGLYRALQTSGTLDKMQALGLEALDVYCVDNILARVADPEYLGCCYSRGGQLGAKVVAKAFPTERVGVFAQDSRGRLQVSAYAGFRCCGCRSMLLVLQ
eukprot:GHRR01031124.1.p1 GENE.GHRR01031124.1~~GHRR01031124.1.p1  ORF type:complete len:203 (+),score=29.36 GHRR01031124.1:110-718(+)